MFYPDYPRRLLQEFHSGGEASTRRVARWPVDSAGACLLAQTSPVLTAEEPLLLAADASHWRPFKGYWEKFGVYTVDTKKICEILPLEESTHGTHPVLPTGDFWVCSILWVEASRCHRWVTQVLQHHSSLYKARVGGWCGRHPYSSTQFPVPADQPRPGCPLRPKQCPLRPETGLSLELNKQLWTCHICILKPEMTKLEGSEINHHARLRAPAPPHTGDPVVHSEVHQTRKQLCLTLSRAGTPSAQQRIGDSHRAWHRPHAPTNPRPLLLSAFPQKDRPADSAPAARPGCRLPFRFVSDKHGLWGS